VTATASRERIDQQWDFGDPGGSEARFRTLRSEIEANGDPHLLGILLTQIARAQGLQRRFAEAHGSLDGAEPLVGLETPGRVRYLLERGRVHNSSGERRPALQLFLEAWELGQRVGEPYDTVDAAHMLAIVTPADERIGWHEQAIALAESSGDERTASWIGSLLNNLAWTLHDAGRYADALATFERARDWQSEHGTARDLRIAHWSVGRTLRSIGRYAEALEIQYANVDRAASIGDDDGYIDEEIGECLLALGRPDDARPHFARAWERLSRDPWIADQEPHRLARMKGLA
jgi:tetratricopeptide (TPR) repeat protein